MIITICLKNRKKGELLEKKGGVHACTSYPDIRSKIISINQIN